MLKGEWSLFRYGWVCPWCTLGTVGLGAAALLSWGTARARPPLSAWGAALLALGLPLALLRAPDAPREAPGRFPSDAESVEAIERKRLTLSADASTGVGVFIGDPRAPGARDKVVDWARARRKKGWNLVYRSVLQHQTTLAQATARALRSAWSEGRPGWEDLFSPGLSLESLRALQRKHGWSSLGTSLVPVDSGETELRLMGFRKGHTTLLDCPPNDVCHAVAP